MDASGLRGRAKKVRQFRKRHGALLAACKVLEHGAPLGKLGAKLTMLSKEQASYIGVNQCGPFKPDSYRY